MAIEWNGIDGESVWKLLIDIKKLRPTRSKSSQIFFLYLKDWKISLNEFESPINEFHSIAQH